MRNNIDYQVAWELNTKNNYTQFILTETRLQDNFSMGEFQSLSMRLTMQHVKSTIKNSVVYRYNNSSFEKKIFHDEDTEIHINAKFINGDGSLFDYSPDRELSIVGTDLKINGATIILRAIPYEDYNDSLSNVYLSGLEIVFKVHLPLEELVRHITNIEKNNDIIYKVQVKDGFYTSLDEDEKVHKVFPKKSYDYNYQELNGPSRLGSIEEIRFDYINKHKTAFNIFK